MVNNMKTAQEMHAIALPAQEANQLASIAYRKERKVMVLADIMRQIEGAAEKGDMSCFLDINDYPEADREIINELKDAGYIVDYVYQHDYHDDVCGWHVSWHPAAIAEKNLSRWSKIKSWVSGWFVGCET